MARSMHYYIRKTHRWLGLSLGIQFLLWTIGGLYFSWSNLNEVHGDLQKKEIPLLSADLSLVSPSLVIQSIQKIQKADEILSIQLINLLGKPYYQIRSKANLPDANRSIPAIAVHTQLADAGTGNLRGPLTREEAIEVARRHFNGPAKVTGVAYLTTTGPHHEYREGPLPVYAVSFDHPSQTTVYIASELGTVQKFRNNPWRVFDFLWMMHTMDYESRDHFGNTLLRIFSLLGLVTVCSGFALFFVSLKRKRKKVLLQK